MKTVFFFDHVNFFGGAEAHLLELARGFASIKNRNVYVVCPPGSVLEKKLKEALINVIAIDFPPLRGGNPFRIMKNFLSFKESFRVEFDNCKHTDDVFFISNTSRSYMYTAFLYPFFRKFCQIWIFHYYVIPKKVLALLKYIPRHFIAVSQNVKDFYNLPRTVVIPNAFSVPRVDQEERRFMVKTGGFNIGFFGRIVRWKGLDVLIDAVNILILSNYNVSLLVYGSPSDVESTYFDSVNAQVQRLGLKDHVRFKGFISEVIPAMSECDVVVSASVSKYGGPESFGRSLIEAMIAGVPVISTSCGGVPEIIVSNYNGVLVKENDANELAEAISTLINDASIGKKYLVNARQSLRKYLKENIALEYDQLMK